MLSHNFPFVYLNLMYCVLFFTTLFSRFVSMHSLTRVELACAGQIYPSHAAALDFIGPAYDAGVETVNRLYAGVFNFTLTYLPGPDSIRDCLSMREVAVDLVAHWYYKDRSSVSDVQVILTPGTKMSAKTFHFNRINVSMCFNYASLY